MYERTSSLCLKCLVLASVITLIRALVSLWAKTLRFIYFYFRRIIDCCLSSHPHLRESIYLNLTNAPVFNSFKYKWGRNWLVTRWFLSVFPPQSLKNIKRVNNSFLPISAEIGWNIYSAFGESQCCSLTPVYCHDIPRSLTLYCE